MIAHEVEVGARLPQLEPLENIVEHNALVLFERYSKPNLKDAPVLDYVAFTKVVERLDLDKVDERMLYQGIQNYLMEAPSK